MNSLVHNFLPCTPMHSVTDRQTDGKMDGQTDDRMMPIADHTVQQYDRLKADFCNKGYAVFE